MWTDETRPATSRVHRRRLVVGLVLGVVAGAVAVAVAVGLLPVTAVAVPTAAAIGGAWLLRTAPERTLVPGSNPLPSVGYAAATLDTGHDVLPVDEVREARVGFFGRLRVTPKTLVTERLLATTAARLEDLAWAYGVRDPTRRWIPFLTDASLVLKFSNGADVTLPCFYRQVVPCLSALRHFAGHVALGWDPELATSWEENRAAFVASVQARLGRVSGAGGNA